MPPRNASRNAETNDEALALQQALIGKIVDSAQDLQIIETNMPHPTTMSGLVAPVFTTARSAIQSIMRDPRMAGTTVDFMVNDIQATTNFNRMHEAIRRAQQRNRLR